MEQISDGCEGDLLEFWVGNRSDSLSEAAAGRSGKRRVYMGEQTQRSAYCIGVNLEICRFWYIEGDICIQ